MHETIDLGGDYFAVPFKYEWANEHTVSLVTWHIPKRKDYPQYKYTAEGEWNKGEMRMNNPVFKKHLGKRWSKFCSCVQQKNWSKYILIKIEYGLTDHDKTWFF